MGVTAWRTGGRYRTAALLLALALGVGACTGESASPDALPRRLVIDVTAD